MRHLQNIEVGELSRD